MTGFELFDHYEETDADKDFDFYEGISELDDDLLIGKYRESN